jgi:anti-anti-sigma factor
VRVDGPVTTVSLAGELDMMTLEAVQALLAEASSRDDCRTVQVDLAAVRFLDSSTIGLLIQAQADAAERGRQLVVINPHGIPRRVLEISGVLGLLTGQT